ncbi:MAG: right-handed parallel beta-helix repeat-containing protein, partial [Prolixibacteraceae bacterium]|nr:right-handed parallel beta-helix repeat-containing protein [Prolixibacteraceae bacterium]
LELNNPSKLNCMGFEMLNQLNNAVCNAEKSEDVKVVLIKGAGERAFSTGADLVLEKGKIYRVDATLKLTQPGQRIYTEDVQSIRDYATIQLVNPTLVTIINAEGLKNIVIKNVHIDGNRDNMRPETGKIPMKPFISLGKQGGDDQIIKNCIITNARCSGGWAAIHVHEHAFRTVIQDNIIFGSGTDVLGNGRSALEYPFGWGDGISVAARNSTIKNNLIIDATDEGIMVQGTPGTKVENNVIVSFSREVLGGIALIDPADYCLLDSIENTYDYRGVEVKNNLVHALGARVHIGYPCGADVWNWNKRNKIIVGAEVADNKMIGKIGGYGYAVGDKKNGAWRVTQLQECRVQLFMEQLYLAFDKRKDNSWPEAHQLHQHLFSRYAK